MSYDILAGQETINKTLSALKAKNYDVHFVQNRGEALEKLKTLIPAGEDLMTGSSTTLSEIGFVDLLKSKNHPWKNWKDQILAETDPVKQNELRVKSVSAKYFLGSVHALTEDGVAIIASASGSQLPGYAYTSDHVVWVISAQKIVKDFDEGMKRLKEYVVPLENERMKSVGMGGTSLSKILIFDHEIMPNRKIHVILVNEKLGF